MPFHFLNLSVWGCGGGGWEVTPQEAKSSICFCEDITYMGVPSQIVCYCYTKILYSIYIFQDCSLKCVGRNDPYDPFPSPIFDGLESKAPFLSPFTQAVNVTLKFYCVLYAMNLTIADTNIHKQTQSSASLRQYEMYAWRQYEMYAWRQYEMFVWRQYEMYAILNSLIWVGLFPCWKKKYSSNQ